MDSNRDGGRLGPGVVALLLLLAMIWGANMAAVKVASRDMSPLFMAGLRSTVAGLCLLVWMRLKGMTIFPDLAMVGHGLVVGLAFGAEFAFIYVGLNHTLASHTVVLVYTAPFFVALGAHWWLPGDRLDLTKLGGLVLAFSGVATLLAGGSDPLAGGSLTGDMMALIAGVLWAATTLYIKGFMAGRASAVHILFYQLLFSAPLLFLCSLVWEDQAWRGGGWTLAANLFFQCVVVAFLSYLAWFRLVNRYPVSLLHGFTFFTPVFGVFLSGVLLLGEPLTLRLSLCLGLVSLGMVLLNRQPRAA
jgi:drug/metabolite transporter (DMT)-like permease